MRGLLLIFGLPLLEIALFVTIGGRIGLWLTLGIILGTALLGVAILKRRGLATAGLAQQAANPLSLAADNGLVMAAALLLILPGFFTDTLGLLLLIPPLRAAIRHQLGQRMGLSGVVLRTGRGGPRQDDIIDAEFVDVTERESQPNRMPSKWTEH